MRVVGTSMGGYWAWVYGQQIGASDEWGYKALEQPISAHDMHATILHLLGLDHEKLTYRYSGRDYRLSDIEGKPIPQIIA